MAALFDAYVMVDWSAASVPRQGRDSIWIAERRRTRRGDRRTTLVNPPTRQAATALLAARLERHATEGRRVLVGFDFPFGYPAGTVDRLCAGGESVELAPAWRRLWRAISDGMEDDDANRNNRFDLAARLNERLSGEAFPFWGAAGEEHRPYLRRRGRRPHGPDDLAERRICERYVRRTQPVWKLAGVGAVGGQALTGIPRVQVLRHRAALADISRIWPFETGLRHDPAAQILFAEIYPSLVAPTRLEDRPKDAGQVDAVTRWLARADSDGALSGFFAGPGRLRPPERRAAAAEEAWILGVT